MQDITGSMESLQMLGESEARYRQLFALTPLPMILRNEETLKFIDVNDACLATYGYTREEMLNMTAVDIQVPEQRWIARARRERHGDSGGVNREMSVARGGPATSWRSECSKAGPRLSPAGEKVRARPLRDRFGMSRAVRRVLA